MNNNEDQELQGNNAKSVSANDDNKKLPEVPKMQDRAGNDLKEQHTETPTESGNINKEEDDTTNETIGTP